MPDSILSTEEAKIASHLADGDSTDTIADALDRDPEAIEKATDRIRAKTDRALATLLQSPFAAEAAAELTDDQLDQLLASLEGKSGERGGNE